MALWYDVSNVKVQEKATNKEGKLTNLSNLMIYMSIPVGINELTEKNVDTFFERARKTEIVSGAWRTLEDPDNKNGERIDLFLSKEEVNAFIGMKTNVSPITTKQFNSTLAKKALDKLERIGQDKVKKYEDFMAKYGDQVSDGEDEETPEYVDDREDTDFAKLHRGY